MPSLGGDQYKWYCEIPPLAEPGNYPGGVKTKPPFEMGVDDLEKAGLQAGAVNPLKFQRAAHQHFCKGAGKPFIELSGVENPVIAIF